MSSTMGGSLRAYSDLFRVENSLTGLIGVVIGAVVVNGANFTTEEGVVVSTFGLSVMFFMFSWNAYNDLTDVENDRVNRPDRPLPSGRVDVASAKVGLILTMLLSLSFLMVGLVRLTAMGENG